MSLHPTGGARFLLERQSVSSDAHTATYAGAIYTPEDQYDYAVTLTMGEAPAVTAAAAPAPAELESKLTTIARVIARDAKKKQADGLPPWPARILRWRGPK